MLARALGLLLVATLSGGAHGQVTVHQIADSTCREMTNIPQFAAPLLTRQETLGITTGTCEDAGYTVAIGDSTLSLPVPGMSQTHVSMFARTGSQLCGADSMASLTRACAAFDSMNSVGICGSGCERAAQQFTARDADCVVPGEIRNMLNVITATCAGEVSVTDGAVGDSIRVGAGGRCAIGRCERDGRCPRCTHGLTCVSASDIDCDGVCFGSCQAPTDFDCQTCAQLGWIANTCGEGGECHGGQQGTSLPTVCGESDASGLTCTNAVNHAEAEELCMGIGARLCTAEELYTYGESSGTGCMHDRRLIWSSSSTLAPENLNCGPYEKVVVTGGMYNADQPGLAPRCMNVAEAGAALRCCADTVCNRPDTTLRHVADDTPEISAFTALLKSNLDDVLDTKGPFTILAPNNAAMRGSVGAQLARLSGRELREHLKYHVISGEVLSDHLTNNARFETFDHGSTVMVRVSDAARGTGITIVGGPGSSAAVTQMDVAASNGVIHIIDTVLVPPAPGTRQTVPCATCSELGWDPNNCGEGRCRPGQGNPNVCGESDDGFTCQNAVSFERAQSACSEFGARLCTAEELMGGEAEGTGCGHDFRYVWSSSARLQVAPDLAPTASRGSIVCPDGQRVVVLGNQGPGGGGSLTVEGRTFPDVAHCVREDATEDAGAASLRCCADTVCSGGESPGSGH